MRIALKIKTETLYRLTELVLHISCLLIDSFESLVATL